MMGWIYQRQFCGILLIFLSLLASSSASTFLSYGIFGDHVAAGRNLLQAKQGCPINFEFENYTIITSQCKGPQYPPNLCCPAFKKFACPFVDQINDLTNECATIMFSYINLNGKYPPGLFASECREGKEGLECPAPPPSQPADDSSSPITLNQSTSLLIFAMTFVVLFLRLF